MLRRRPLFVACALALACPSLVLAADPVSDEVVLNAATAGEQHSPAVAIASEGAYVAAWIEEAGGTQGIVFDRPVRTLWGDAPLGEQRVWTGTVVSGPRIAMSHYGFAWVAWAGDGADGDGAGVMAAQIDYLTNAATLIPTNQYTAGQQSHVDVATSTYGGSVVVTWSTQQPGGGYGLRARMLYNDHVVGDEIVIDSEYAAAPRESSVAVNNSAYEFAVAWTKPPAAGGQGMSIVVQRFDGDGSPMRLPIEVASGETCANRTPALAFDSQGGFVVAWECVGTIMAARYNEFDELIGTWVVADGAVAAGRKPEIGIDGSGNFTIAWESLRDGWRMIGRRFGDDGSAGPEFTFGSSEAPQYIGDIGIDNDGDLIGVWTGSDGDGSGVLERRFRGGYVDLLLRPTPGSGVSSPVPAGSRYEHRLTLQPYSPGTGCATGVTVRVAKPETGAEYGPFIVDYGTWTCSEAVSEHVCRLPAPVCFGSEDSPELRVSYEAPPYASIQVTDATVTSDQYEMQEVNNSVSIHTVTLEGDSEPDPFSFTDAVDAEPASFVESESIAIGGISVPAEIYVADGEYSINAGPYTSEPGQVRNGDLVRLRHATPDGFEQQTLTLVSIGGVGSSFTSTTRSQDMTPDTFTFVDENPVALDVIWESQSISVSGIDSYSPVSVTGGEYSVDGGSYTSSDGIVIEGQTVRVRHTTSATPSSETHTTLTIGGVSDTFTTTTIPPDITPDAFTLGDRTDVQPSSAQVSDAFVVSGTTGAAPIGVSNGEYSIDGGAFTSAAGVVAPGASVRVRHTAAAGFQASMNTLLEIGGVSDVFTTLTRAADTTPDAFAFADTTNVARGTEQVSNAITVAGIESDVAITITGGEYSIDGGAFTSTAGMVASGASVRVRHTSAAGFSASVATQLTMGGVADTYTSTTLARDVVPDAFALADVSGVERSVVITSAELVVAGINDATPISVANGTYSIDGGAFTSAAGTVQAGQRVRVRHTSAGAFATTTNTALTIGGVSDTFSSTTRAADTTPNAFAFVDQTGVKRARLIASNAITVSGIEAPVAITIAGGGGAQYSKNGGAWTSAAGTVSNGDTVTLRLTSSSSQFTTINATLTIGGVADVWSVTTGR